MRILILNGNPKIDLPDFDAYVDNLSGLLTTKENKSTVIKLRDMSLHKCVGCYSCWVKTPGICVFQDDVATILQEYLQADVVLFSSPVIMGFISALLKTFQERCLPLAHPFLRLAGERMQHVPRYEKTPATALLLGRTADCAGCVPTSKDIIEEIFRGNKSSSFKFVKTMDEKPEEIAHALNNI